MSKIYVLLKDLPECKAGTFFERGMYNFDYYREVVSGNKMGIMYPSKIIENTPDWFLEVKEEPLPINDGVSHTYNLNKGEIVSVEVGGVKYLSPEEVLEREKKAFEAARCKLNFYSLSPFPVDKYPTFEDYKKDNP